MDIEIIKQLVSEFKEAELTRLSLKCESFEIKLEKEKEMVQVAPQQVIQSTTHYPVSTTQCESDSPKLYKQEDTEVKHITSPMVGTFYASSSPETKPFVTIGSRVKKGDIVCIIEAMKLMNEVEAEVDGEIVEIIAKNEQMVEYAQPLFVIR